MSLTVPTTAPVRLQKEATIEQGFIFLEMAARARVQIFCFQELWTMPMGFCTGEKLPWVEFAEDAISGHTTQRLKQFAKAHDMVIVSPILERDSNDEVWNSAVVIDANGEIVGTYRKTHIPIAGNESAYFRHSNRQIPVFKTKYGIIGISLCYDRHFPSNWYSLRLAGSEVVFNPCASIASFSEHLWPIEGRAAAVAHGFYVASINRVGTEVFEDSKAGRKERKFYGSSYVASPNGTCTPGLSTEEPGILVADIDLTQCRNYLNGDRTHAETLEGLAEISKTFASRN